MSISLDELDNDPHNNPLSLYTSYLEPKAKQETEYVDDREDAHTIRKTQQLRPHLRTDLLRLSSSPSLEIRANPVSNALNHPISSDLENYRNELIEIRNSETIPNKFPHLAWEAVKAGLAKEQLTNAQIQKHVQEVEKIQKQIDLLLDLSAELTSHKDGDPMSEKTKDILEKLKNEHEIDLWKGDDFNKEQVSTLKSLSSSKIDQLRSNLQIIFTTKVQVLIQMIGSIMEVLKDIIRQFSSLIKKTLQLPGH